MNATKPPGNKNRHLLTWLVLGALLLGVIALSVISALHEPESGAGVDSTTVWLLTAGIFLVVVVGVLLLFRFMRRSSRRQQQIRMAPLADWAEARRWRVRAGEELETRTFPDVAKGVRVTPRQCLQSIEGEMLGRRISVESWQLDHRNLGAPVSQYVSRPIVRVNASPYLPTVGLGAGQSSSFPWLTAPKQLADRRMTTQGALSHVPVDLLSDGITRVGPFYCFGPPDEVHRLVPLVQRFQQAMVELQAWVVTSPGELLLTFMEEPENDNVLERRLHLAATMAGDLDQYR
ncbi:MAG TPA: hypothetical protein H9830_10400 [Candidatus Agrococcus pullicola]|uniref:Uncharacterized protein n=1 Tax=Candidatus Agrococcus pullicola TaxID=2838429 RepID=A0A9D1YWW6_9MICO|nr:hypothetical protein [Candidatus Agrococcus pullicola]